MVRVGTKSDTNAAKLVLLVAKVGSTVPEPSFPDYYCNSIWPYSLRKAKFI